MNTSLMMTTSIPGRCIKDNLIIRFHESLCCYVILLLIDKISSKGLGFVSKSRGPFYFVTTIRNREMNNESFPKFIKAKIANEFHWTT